MELPFALTPVTFIFAVFLYLAPAIIGSKRELDGSGFLWICNVLFGWTILGWAVLLGWALIGQTRESEAYRRRIAAVLGHTHFHDLGGGVI